MKFRIGRAGLRSMFRVGAAFTVMELWDALQEAEDEAKKIAQDQTKLETLMNVVKKLASRIGDRVVAMAEMAEMHIKGVRMLPTWEFAKVMGCLVYIASPIDIIPDTIPVIGLIDDVAVYGLCVPKLKRQHQRFRRLGGEQPLGLPNRQGDPLVLET